MKRVVQRSSDIDLTFVRSTSAFESRIDIVLYTGSMESDFKSSTGRTAASAPGNRNDECDQRIPAASRSYAARPVDDRDRGTSGGPDGPRCASSSCERRVTPLCFGGIQMEISFVLR